jgi:hypothetical protein
MRKMKQSIAKLTFGRANNHHDAPQKNTCYSKYRVLCG